jgi:hypothetical protein
VIFVIVSEEVSLHISSINDSYSASKILNEFYDTYSELELIQLMVKLFKIELKNDDPMALDLEKKTIMHDIEAIEVKIDPSLIDFIKTLYHTYSYYL